MNNDYLYNQALTQANSVPPENRAIRSTLLTEPLAKIGEGYARDYTNSAQQASKFSTALRDLRLQRSQLAEAGRQNSIATGIGLGTIAAQGYKAYETTQQAKEEEAARKEYLDKLNYMSHLMIKYKDDVIKMLGDSAGKLEDESGGGKYGLRTDGTTKGNGWLGEIPLPNNKVATELSATFNYGGGDTLVPTIIPGMRTSNIDKIKAGISPLTIPSMRTNAANFGKYRLSNGLSPFPTQQDIMFGADNPYIYYNRTEE